MEEWEQWRQGEGEGAGVWGGLQVVQLSSQGWGAELDPGFGMEGVKSCPPSFAVGREHPAGVKGPGMGSLGRMEAAGLALAVSDAQGCAAAHVALQGPGDAEPGEFWGQSDPRDRAGLQGWSSAWHRKEFRAGKVQRFRAEQERGAAASWEEGTGPPVKVPGCCGATSVHGQQPGR